MFYYIIFLNLFNFTQQLTVFKVKLFWLRLWVIVKNSFPYLGSQ